MFSEDLRDGTERDTFSTAHTISHGSLYDFPSLEGIGTMILKGVLHMLTREKN